MSKPSTGTPSKPAIRAAAIAPTMPAAGPERMVSLACSLSGACNAPLEVITRSGVAGPNAPCTCCR